MDRVADRIATDVSPPGMARGDRDKLALEQLRLALTNLRPNFWLMPVCAAIVCAMFWRWASWQELLLWFAIVAAGGAPLGFVANRFPKSTPASPDARTWIARATLSYALFALTWSSMGALLWRAGDDLNHMVVILIVACTLAGSSALTGASKPLAIAGYAVYGATLVLLPLRQGGAIYEGLSLLALLYVGYLAYMSRQIYFTARSMLLLRDDKNDLISALAGSKVQSDAAAARAEAASRAKSQFLANMSHELRTPLNAILGFSEMIQSGHFGAAKHAEYAGLIHKSGRHLLALIDDILDLAKIEAGGLQLHERDIDVAALEAECVGLMSSKAKEAQIVLDLTVSANLPRLHADERALKQVIINLLSNALKFTQAGGRIAVFARIESDGAMALGVADTGVGIAEEDRARVFEDFGQGRHDVVTEDKGTGLGLPIVKGLVAAHGGRVALDSHVAEGTTVTILMPASRVRAPLKAAS